MRRKRTAVEIRRAQGGGDSSDCKASQKTKTEDQDIVVDFQAKRDFRAPRVVNRDIEGAIAKIDC